MLQDVFHQNKELNKKGEGIQEMWFKLGGPPNEEGGLEDSRTTAPRAGGKPYPDQSRSTTRSV